MPLPRGRVVLVASYLSTLPSGGAAAPEDAVVPGLLMLKFATPVVDDADAASRVAGLAASGGLRYRSTEKAFPTAAPGLPRYGLKQRIGLDRWVRVRLDESLDPVVESARWASRRDVEIAECVARSVPAFVPNDPLFAQQWEHINTGSNPTVPPGTPDADLDTDAAWDSGIGGVRVANLESVDWYHEDLVANVWQNLGEDLDGDGVLEWDSTLARYVFDPDDGNLFDDDGNGYRDDLIGWNLDDTGNQPEIGASDHGTGTAGFLLGVPDNGVGVAGVCGGCELIAVKAAQSIEGGIVYAVDQGAKVVNLSLIALLYTQAFEDALEYAHASGTLVVVAAGNGGLDPANELCANSKALCVGATDHLDRIVTLGNTGGIWGSHHGARLDVAAPGRYLTYLRAGAGYASNGSGTSFASPIAAGVAALVRSTNPALSTDEVISILQSTADPFVSPDRFAGLGRINADRAVGRAAAAAVFGSHPAAVIQTLTTAVTLEGELDIYGTADSPDLTGYTIRVGAGLGPTTWLVEQQFAAPVTDGLLASYEVTTYPESTALRIELEVEDSHGQVAVDAVHPVWKDYSACAAGWPVYEPSATYGTPTIGDVDGLGGDEVVVPSGGALNVLGAAGALLPGWPITGFTTVRSPAALTDVDDDGDLDIVVAYENGVGPGWISIYREDASVAPGWPQPLPSKPLAYPAVGDVDGDGEEDIVQLADVPAYQVVVRSRSGGMLPGWPRSFPILVEGPTLADLDGDGAREILVREVFLLHALGADGLDVTGWPVQSAFGGLVAAADLDLDGRDEVISISGSSVFVHRHDGTVAPGWPQAMSAPGRRVFAADVDANGVPDVVAEATNGLVHVFSSGGMPFPGWPRNMAGALPACVADADGDTALELISWLGREARAMELDGSASAGWPLLVSGTPIVTGVAVGDVLGDGTLDVLVTATIQLPLRGLLYLYETTGARFGADWLLEHGDNRNSRHVTASPATGAPPVLPPDLGFALLPAQPNPTAGGIVFRWVQPRNARTRLRVFDVSGRLVATLLDEDVPAGVHSTVWARPGAGVHFARLEAPPFSAVQKVVSLR
jgi:hypothetical protein